MCDVSKGVGDSPEKRTYDVSRGHNRYVRLPLEEQFRSNSNIELYILFYNNLNTLFELICSMFGTYNVPCLNFNDRL